MLEEVNKEDWVQWRENAVTKKVFGMIHSRREEAIERLAFGEHSGSPSKTNIMVGLINAYTHILNMRYDEDNNG